MRTSMSFLDRKKLSASGLALVLTAIVATLGLGACGGGGGRANVEPHSMPSGGTFTGVWHSPQYGEMQLVQTGTQVVGEYTKDERRGQIQGTATGDLMRFEWSERRELVSGHPITQRGRGYFQYSTNSDGDAVIDGQWGHDSSETGGGPWTAVRDRRRRATLGGGGSSGTNDGMNAGDQGDDLDGPGGSGGSRSSGGSDDLDGF